MTNHSAPPDEQAFPLLDVSQIAKLRPFGTTRSTCANEVLIEVGDDIPGASMPWTWNTFLAISKPIVVICMWTAP